MGCALGVGEGHRPFIHVRNPNDESRKHGEPWFSGTLVIGDPQEDVENSRDCFDFSSVFLGFSGRGFWKIIRAGLPHFFGPV